MAAAREAILGVLRRKREGGRPIIGAGAGTGISAKSEVAGGVDLIVVYNSGRYRMAGLGSMAGLMPYGNANEIVRELGPEILNVAGSTPVLAGVCGTDPFLLRRRFLLELREMGFAGIQNFPTVGLIDGVFRQNLEETGMCFSKEIELIAEARALEMLTTPYVFDPEQACAMAEAGADVLVAHMGLTTQGTIGARTARSLEQCVVEIDAIVRAARVVRPDLLVICHGGPIAQPEDAQFIMDRCEGVDGFYGASSMERLPTEVAIAEQVARFARLRVKSSACGGV